jgi:hypothetical protein
MKIKHYSRRHLTGIRQRLKKIIELSHRNRIDSSEVASCELMADSIPSAKRLQLEVAQGIRKRIAERQAEIETYKDWIKRMSPHFFKKVSSVQCHITTWDLDMPAIRLTPIRGELVRKKHPDNLTLKKRKANLAKRRLIMSTWYCFFFGDEHLKSSCLENGD